MQLYYARIVTATAFVAMTLRVTVRTAFSLFLRPLFGACSWERTDNSGTLAFGFLCSAVMSPLAVRVIDRRACADRVVLGLLRAPHSFKPPALFRAPQAAVGGSGVIGISKAAPRRFAGWDGRLLHKRRSDRLLISCDRIAVGKRSGC